MVLKMKFFFLNKLIEKIKSNFDILKDQKNIKGFLKTFLFFTLIIFVSFSFFTSLSLEKEFKKILNDVDKTIRQQEIYTAKNHLKQYFVNRVQVLKDISSNPLIISALMKKNSSVSIKKFLDNQFILGEKRKLYLINTSGELILKEDAVELKYEFKESVEKLSAEKKAFDINFFYHNDKKYYSLLVPAIYGNTWQGFLYLEAEFDFNTIWGADYSSTAVSFALQSEDTSIEDEKYASMLGKEAKSFIPELDLIFVYKSSSGYQKSFIDRFNFKIFMAIVSSTLITILIVLISGLNLLIKPYAQIQASESALKEKTKDLKLTLSAAQIGLWTWDMKTGLVSWDENLYKLMGRTKDNFDGSYESFERDIVAEDKVKIRDAVGLCLEENRGFEESFRITHPISGEMRYLAGKADLEYDLDGTVIGMRGVNYDITKSKQQELELERKSLELERSNKDLEQFAYVASHDLQEPLRTVQNYSKLLTRAIEKLEIEDQELSNYAEFITNAVQRMKALVLDVLAYSKVSKDDKFITINLNRLITEICNDLEKSIEDRGAKVNFSDLPVIRGQATEIKQLFTNLISNAIKYTKPEINPEVSISVRERKDHYEFSVTDNGIGIKPEYQEKVFQIFQRLHNKSEYDGTGIGLALCKKIVDHHSGKIWLESEYDKGTSFFFTLKFNTDEAQVKM